MQPLAEPGESSRREPGEAPPAARREPEGVAALRRAARNAADGGGSSGAAGDSPRELLAAIDALLTHLDAERDRLQTLCTVLDEESAALRRMALDDIIDIAQRKQGLLEAHQVLAQARSARLAAIGAQSLDECVARCSPAQAVRLAELRTSMAELARHATERNAWNHAFAESGRALVEGALRVVRRLHAGSSATYAANGQVTAGERRTRVDRRA